MGGKIRVENRVAVRYVTVSIHSIEQIAIGKKKICSLNDLVSIGYIEAAASAAHANGPLI